MNRRTFLKVCAAISGAAMAPKIAATIPLPNDAVTWITEDFDYGLSMGLCGQIGDVMNTTRTAIFFPMFYRFTPEQQKAAVAAGKEYIRRWLASKQNCVYGDAMLAGNEIKVDMPELLKDIA